jgi:glycerophosphoryl diester phosphodiesterase
VLDLIGGKVPLLIEIKDQSLVMGPTDGRLEAATAEALKGYTGDVALMSFNPASVAHMARLAPHVPRGITTSAYDPDDWAPMPADMCAHFRTIPDYDASLSSFISHEAPDLARPRVAELKRQGAKVLCWTIRSALAEAEARKVADNVTFEGYAPTLPA